MTWCAGCQRNTRRYGCSRPCPDCLRSRATRRCVDCGRDISYRHGAARHCESCSASGGGRESIAMVDALLAKAAADRKQHPMRLTTEDIWANRGGSSVYGMGDDR